jgi:hypothetical protein
MKNLPFIPHQLNHSNHLSRQAPPKYQPLQQVRESACHSSRAHSLLSFGPGRGQGITTHSIPRGERSGNRRLAKGPEKFDLPEGVR